MYEPVSPIGALTWGVSETYFVIEGTLTSIGRMSRAGQDGTRNEAIASLPARVTPISSRR